MKALLLALTLAAGCGAVFNDDETYVDVFAPTGLQLMMDGMPITAGHVRVNAHHDHNITAIRKDGTIAGTCRVDSSLQARYLVLDIMLGLVPVIVDAATGDWYAVETPRCDFR